MPKTESVFMENEDKDETTIQDVLFLLRQRIALIAVVVLVCLAAGVLLSFSPRKYAASGTIRVQPGMSSMYRTSPMAVMSGEESDKIASEVKILQSRTLYLQVAGDLNLVNDPAFWGKKRLKEKLTLDDPVTREKVARLMKKKLKVAHDTKDEIITITCLTNSPALSAKIVNTMINDYIEQLFKMHYGATNRTSQWLMSQLDDLKQQIERDQADLVTLQGKLGVIGFDEKSSNYLLAESLSDMTKANSEATIARIEAEAKYRFLKEADPNLIEGEINLLNQGPLSNSNSLLQNLRNALAQTQASYTQMLTQYGPNYPEVRQQKARLDELKREVSAEQSRILNQARLSYDAARTNEAMAEKTLEDKKNSAFGASNDMVKYSILLHDYEAHRTLYEALVERLREAGITSGMEAGEIDVIDLADLPALPSPPGPVLLVSASMLGGLLLGVIVALVLETLDSRISTMDQAEKVLGATPLSLTPHLKQKKKNEAAPTSPFEAVLSPKSRYAESIQTLRTSILLSKAGKPPQVILISSSMPAEGKTTTSLSLAAVLARHHHRVLVLDADLRCGSIAARLNLSEKRGLSDVLSGVIDLEQAIQAVPEIEGLSVLVGGTRPPDPAVLISSPQMKDLLVSLRERFDFIVIDAAPTIGISDTFNLAPQTDGVVVVVRLNFSTKKAIERTRNLLMTAKLPVLGFVLNDVGESAERHGYGYGYGYGYAYGYGEAESYFDGAKGGK